MARAHILVVYSMATLILRLKLRPHGVLLVFKDTERQCRDAASVEGLRLTVVLRCFIFKAVPTHTALVKSSVHSLKQVC